METKAQRCGKTNRVDPTKTQAKGGLEYTEKAETGETHHGWEHKGEGNWTIGNTREKTQT